MKGAFRARRGGWSIALVALVASAQLFAPPLVGIANNGDFERMMHWGRFDYPAGMPAAEKYFNWVVPRFVRAPGPARGYPSTEAVFVKGAALLCDAAGTRTLDIRWLGALHLFGFLAAFALLAGAWRRLAPAHAAGMTAGFLLIFCDLDKLLLFHSFYAEAASLVFFLGFAAWGLRLSAEETPRAGGEAVLAVLLLLLALAKAQNLPLLVPGLLYLALRARKGGSAVRAIAAAAAAAGVGLAIVCLSVLTPAMRRANAFHAVFDGIARVSPDFAGDLADLGADPRLAGFAGADILRPEEERRFRAAGGEGGFFSRVGPAAVARFYLRHPSRLARALSLTAESAVDPRLEPTGNFTRGSGRPPRAKARRLSLWGDFEADALPHRLWFFAAWWAAAVAVLLRGALRPGAAGRACRFGLVLAAMAALAFATPVVGDGIDGLPRHLGLFDFFFDFSWLGALAGISNRAARPKRSAILAA